MTRTHVYLRSPLQLLPFVGVRQFLRIVRHRSLATIGADNTDDPAIVIIGGKTWLDVFDFGPGHPDTDSCAELIIASVLEHETLHIVFRALESAETSKALDRRWPASVPH